MIRIRRFEEKCYELYTQEKIRGFLHLYDRRRGGRGRCHTGAGEARSRGRNLPGARTGIGSRGADDDGSCRNVRQAGGLQPRARRLHAPVRSGTNFYGGNAIVGGGLPLAVGLALADRMRGDDVVTACFFGDGAVAEGEFHESLNLAALWSLPVLFVCENNLYAMGTALAMEESETDLHLKAQSYRIAAEAVDGMDVIAVEAAARRAVRAVRETRKPYFLECRTYRFRAHSMFDAQLYRDKAEIEAWRKNEPIVRFRGWLEANHMIHAEEETRIEADIAAEIAAAVAFAEAGTWELVEDLTRFVYAEKIRLSGRLRCCNAKPRLKCWS